MFGRKKKAVPKLPFDPEKQTAVIRCSICTGEQAAGFKDKETGKFHEVMVIKNAEDLESFKKSYHLKEITKEY